MNEAPGPDESMAARAAGELAQLRAQADEARRQVQEARAALTLLRRDLEEARALLHSSRSVQLLAANEELVLAMLKAQADAERTSLALQKATRSSELDALTELPNRVRLLDRFAQAMAAAKRHGGRLALLFLDLNNFKQVNDTLGHAFGDELLKLVARRLVDSVREADTVCRHGGDEFLILLTEVSQASDAILIADKLIAALAAPSRVGDHVIRLTASIGVSIYPDDGEDATTLIDRADAAMYRAKRRGPGNLGSHDEAPSPTHDRSVGPSPISSLQHPLTRFEAALAEHERRRALLQEANERLVLAALDAQELQLAAERARQRQTDFLAVLAHELRNPLAPIRTAAELLGRVPQDKVPEVQAVIERQVAHMSRLVGDLLDVSRISTGKLRIERQPFDMAGVVDDALSACKPAMDTRLQSLHVHLPTQALRLHGDPVRLTQMLCNLLDNASKYTRDGGETRLTVAVVGDAIVITVSDNGIGITAEALPNIFEPFVQDRYAVGFNASGLGIGLTVVRELVQAHGGTVAASSAGTDRGSEFVVTLSLARLADPHPE